MTLLLGSLLALRVYPNASWKPSGTGDPALGIPALLAVAVGLPYFLLSATGPLLQAWYARQFHGAVPYRLYALSNAGAMFALLSYPFLFEPVSTTREQAAIWSAAYGAFLLLCMATAIRAGRAADVAPPGPAPEAAAGNGQPGAREYAFWLLLPACASVLLLAVSNHIAQNVAAIPLLWVLPLSLYLLSFILCFDGRGWFRYRRFPYVPLMAVFLGGMALAIDGLEHAPIALVAGLFALGLVRLLHGVPRRADPAQTPSAVPHPVLPHHLRRRRAGRIPGRVRGSSPLSFQLRAGTRHGLLRRRQPWRPSPTTPRPSGCATSCRASNCCPPRSRRCWPAISASSTGTSFSPSSTGRPSARQAVEPTRDFDACLLLLALLWLAGVLLVLRRGVRLRWVAEHGVKPFAVELLALMLIGYLGYQVGHANTGYRKMVRNFYGALKVTDTGSPEELDSTRGLLHGTINHGEQFLNPARRRLPTTYYAEESGIGIAIRDKQLAPGRMRVGVIGLGAGTTAAYGRPATTTASTRSTRWCAPSPKPISRS